MAENKLTDKSLRALKPTDAEQTIGDGGGLWVRILPKTKGCRYASKNTQGCALKFTQGF